MSETTANPPTYILSDAAISLGFIRNLAPSTNATSFIDKSLITSTHPDEPLYYLIEQQDNLKYQAQLDPKAPKTKGLQDTLNLDQHATIKSLMFYDVKSKAPCCILMHGDYTVNTRLVAKALGTRGVQPLSVEDANAASGYIVGGTSGFGLKTPMPIIIQESILELDWVIINGGGHYKYLLIRPQHFVAIFQSEHSKSLGFIVHVVPCGKPRQERIKVDEADAVTSSTEPNTPAESNPVSPQHAQSQTVVTEPPEQTQLTSTVQLQTDFDPAQALIHLRHELTVLTSAFDQNNITNQFLTATSQNPSHSLLLFQPIEHVTQLVTAPSKSDTTNNSTETAPRVPILINHWIGLQIPALTSSSPSMSNESSSALESRSILLQFGCTLPVEYPFKPVENIKLSSNGMSDFYSTFNIEEFVNQLQNLSFTYAAQGKEHVLELMTFINEHYRQFFRHHLQQQLHQEHLNSTATAPESSEVQSTTHEDTTIKKSAPQHNFTSSLVPLYHEM